MIARAVAIVVLVWALGFAAFVVMLPGPTPGGITDGIVVPTGGPGRIARGATLLKANLAKRMLISGVGMGVGRASLARENDLPRTLFDCCVDLGHEAAYTRENADETVAWVRQRGYRSLRLVTTDWHLPRAHFELERAVGNGVRIVDDAVESHPSFEVLMREYNKYLLRRLASATGF